MFEITDVGGFMSTCDNKDRGFFTVESHDVPACSLRRRRCRGKSRAFFRKMRLAPINERDEMFNDTNIDDINSFVQSSLRCQTDRTHDRLGGAEIQRSRTFTSFRLTRETIPPLQLDLDTSDDELENLTEDENVRTPEATVLEGLPPRPKCKRKVLPPSVTRQDNESPKRHPTRLLKQRPWIQNKMTCKSVSALDNVEHNKDKTSGNKVKSVQLANDKGRPTSAGNKLQVIQLADLRYLNKNGVTDLPRILNNIVRQNEVNNSQQQLSGQQCDTTRTDDSGALSTPRGEDKKQPALRGSDLASFYQVWGRSKTTRPFDRKDTDKPKVRRNRSCLCAIQKCSKGKCGLHRNNILPPIGAAGKEGCT